MSDDIMSQEIFTIDTGANIKQEQKVEPLSLFDDNHPMLSKQIPDYVLPLPNPNMNILINRLKMTDQIQDFETESLLATFKLSLTEWSIKNYSALVEPLNY